MTIIMTAKHQITIPKRIAEALGLKKGSLFSIGVTESGIELVPLDPKEKTFTREEYKKLEALAIEEKGQEKRVTKKFINKLKRG